MKQPQLEKEIRALQSDIYQLAKKTSSYSQGEILKLSQKVDQKIVSYQKLFNHTK
ncbi:aspartyl-phosphate phosphatase Spo0E family protein [Priestia megaterium]|uniref:aspartyl-phosphate phosphatase Spo0E family protein n=1 Tax=Priestia megaterium TaxID=1404 RepID=UPI0021D68FCB|nr:aspartyl-phosphate phosphatase Spo0E family protein [Priestia megaterium]MCU7745894.1 aspartyl-phosphate phosphatase Spo0E family protein [Priestia megaterium]